MENTSSKDKNLEYPSSKSIPFPFARGPYPQQAELMDVMLQTLKIVDERDDGMKLSTFTNDSTASNSNVLSSYNSTKELNHANVMMLESPTGTGKVSQYLVKTMISKVFSVKSMTILILIDSLFGR